VLLPSRIAQILGRRHAEQLEARRRWGDRVCGASSPSQRRKALKKCLEADASRRLDAGNVRQSPRASRSRLVSGSGARATAARAAAGRPGGLLVDPRDQVLFRVHGAAVDERVARASAGTCEFRERRLAAWHSLITNELHGGGAYQVPAHRWKDSRHLRSAWSIRRRRFGHDQQLGDRGFGALRPGHWHAGRQDVSFARLRLSLGQRSTGMQISAVSVWIFTVGATFRVAPPPWPRAAGRADPRWLLMNPCDVHKEASGATARGLPCSLSDCACRIPKDDDTRTGPAVPSIGIASQAVRLHPRTLRPPSARRKHQREARRCAGQERTRRSRADTGLPISS